MLVTKVGKEIKLIPRVETSHCKADGAREMDVLGRGYFGRVRMMNCVREKSVHRGKMCSVRSSPIELQTTLKIPKACTTWQ